ncbi:MAG: hypothetical protein ACXVCX_01690 [Ktedonobacterales bacterium]
MAEKIPPHPPRHIQQPQPDDTFEHDLHPNMLAGEDHSPLAPGPGTYGHTLADVNEMYDKFPDLTHADLKRIPVLPEGARLEQGATYLDAAEPIPGEITAPSGDFVAGPQNLYVPKKDTDYLLWNRLLGVTNRARLDESDAPPPGSGAADS